MGMSECYGPSEDAESIRTIHRAVDLGVTHLDTADIYGRDRNEELVRCAVRDRRSGIILATKFGTVRDGETWSVNGNPEYKNIPWVEER